MQNTCKNKDTKDCIPSLHIYEQVAKRMESIYLNSLDGREVHKMATKQGFGKTKDGKQVFLYTIGNQNGMKAAVTNYGATLVSLWVPDKDGNMADVVLGYDDVTGYESRSAYLGATVGRNSNRIGEGIAKIDGVVYQLDQNENNNNHHGGKDGYSFRIWSVMEVNDNKIKLAMSSEDGDQGLPGTAFFSVTYTVTEDNEIKIEYDGICDRDTIMNFTNHSYFNLKGQEDGSILDHILWIKANEYTPIAPVTSLPTGEIASVEGTPFDFREPKKVGAKIEEEFDQLIYAGGYDHNFVLDKKERSFEKVGYLEVLGKRKMEIFTDTPGIQIYTGNFLDTVGKKGVLYKKRSGIAAESQFFPNAVNTENFPSTIVKAGEKYHSTTVYRFC